MPTLISILVLGFVLGMRHATDADHVIAVSTIVSRERQVGSAAVVGLLWGAGHTLTILAVGGAIILFGIVIPPRLGLAFELFVGVMLIVLGIVNLHGHRHPHGDRLQTHGAPLVVGVMHGLAGSAAVALLALAAIPDPLWGLAYLGVFGLGTIAGMMLVTAASAVPFAWAAEHRHVLARWLGVGSGVASVAFGLFLVYRIGIAGGLFTAEPLPVILAAPGRVT